MVINHLLNGMILQAWSLRGKGLTGTLPGPGAFTPSWSTTSNYGFLGEKHTDGRPFHPVVFVFFPGEIITWMCQKVMGLVNPFEN